MAIRTPGQTCNACMIATAAPMIANAPAMIGSAAPMIVLTDGSDLARWKTSDVAGEILPEHEWAWGNQPPTTLLSGTALLSVT